MRPRRVRGEPAAPTKSSNTSRPIATMAIHKYYMSRRGVRAPPDRAGQHAAKSTSQALGEHLRTHPRNLLLPRAFLAFQRSSHLRAHRAIHHSGAMRAWAWSGSKIECHICTTAACIGAPTTTSREGVDLES